MATLVSPGVDVQIIDESFYASAGAGTVPLIVMATAANKLSPSGTGYAPYSMPENAGKLFLATSQRELVQNFGNPHFYSVQGTQIHGHELNEYGLHAAYTYLGYSNRCYVLRADIDLAQLEPSDTPPRGMPIPGTYWLDLSETTFGVFQNNGNANPGFAWEAQKVIACTEFDVEEVDGQDRPLPSIGQNGDFAVVTSVSNNLIFEKIAGEWYEIGSAAWKAARPTSVVGAANPPVVTSGDQIIINGATVTLSDGSLPGIRDAIISASIPNITALIEAGRLVIRNVAGGNISIENRTGTPLATLGIEPGTYRGVQVVRTADAQYPAGYSEGSVWVKGTSPNKGANWVVKFFSSATYSWTNVAAPFLPFDSMAPETNPNKDAAARSRFGTPAAGTIYVGFDQATGVQQLRRFDGTRWNPLDYVASFEAPTEEPEDGRLWYNTDLRVDIMVGDGNTWIAYRRYYPETDPKGVILMGSQPIMQSDGTPLEDNDLWIDTSDTENYPALYRYDKSSLRWRRVDITDQTTPFGIIFADARADSGVPFEGEPLPHVGGFRYRSERIEDMLDSDYVDPDAPDPRLYPAGMLLFNTRYSTYNVKVWRPRYFEDGNFDPNTNYLHHSYTVGDPNYVFPPVENAGRWVTASGNRLDGSPYMGRKAQRKVIVEAMAAAVNQNEDLRSELVYFNLMAAPGYPELTDELVALNQQQKEISFIIADTPCRLKPLASEFERWAKNPNGYPNGEEGLSTADRYTAIYYPWGLGRNVDGAEVMIPPSTLALCTYAYNDSVAYPWFAPAGFRRGVVTAATTVGYLTDEGEFRPVLLNQGQRDVLYLNKINPIAFIPNRGLVIYGQKTLSPLDSALDRVNVARLMNYLRYNLDNIVKPFLFEQNDQQTRDAARLTVERFLAGLMTLRAIEDAAVLCDETNNTPERRDRNELWIDIAIKPVRAIEFIYIPVRVRNSADSLLFASGE